MPWSLGPELRSNHKEFEEMKNYHGWLLSSVVALATLAAHPAAAADDGTKKTGIRFSLASMPMTIEGLEDAHISDWEKFGLGGSEGRMLLAMGDGNMASTAMPGLRFGGAYRLMPALDLGGECAFHFGDNLGANISASVDYYVWQTEGMRLGVQGRAGVLFASISLGDANILPGYTNPVIVNDDITVRNGDTLKAQLMGFSASGGISFEYDLNAEFSLRFDAGYQIGDLSGASVLIAGEGDDAGTEVKLDHPAIVKTDATSTQAGITPSGNGIGGGGGIGIVYRPK